MRWLLLLYPVQSVKALVEHRPGPFAPPEPALGLDLPVRLPQAVCGLVERQVRRNRRTAAHIQVSLEKHFGRSEEHTSELQSRLHLVCRLLLEKKKKKT